MIKKNKSHKKPSSPKILFLITKSVWGGAAKYVFDLAREMKKEGFDAAVAAGGKGSLAQELVKEEIKYFNISYFQRKVNPFKEPLAFLEILSLLFQARPDIIHANSPKAGGLAGPAILIYRLAFFLKKITSVYTAHGWAVAEARPRWQIFLIKIFSKATALFYDKIICVSKNDRRIAVKEKIAPSSKLFVIYNGIEDIPFLSHEQAFSKLVPQNNKAVPKKTIGSIAEWTKNKGLIYLLKAVKKTQKKGYTFNTILIGSGENPDKDKIKRLISKYKIKNIHLIEFIPQAAKYLKAFDVFILPSIKEGLPYTIIEAMAAERPIIASKVGGIPELIKHNQNGLLVEPRDSQQICQSIKKILDNPALEQKFAQKNRQKISEKFSLKKMARETISLYQE